MPDRISGFITGFVTANTDPLKEMCRIKARIPGFYNIETPFWIWPGNIPGASGGDQFYGSRYPSPALSSRVSIIFENGIWDTADAHAIYLPGHYGYSEAGSQASCSIEGPKAGAAQVNDPRERTVIWEDRLFAIYTVDSAKSKELVIMAKRSGNKLVFDEGGGLSKTAALVYLQARTGIGIYADGLVDIGADMAVQIQGRRVQQLTPDKGI